MKKNNTFIPLLDLCQVLDSKRIPITAEKRKHGPYPYYGANGIQDYIDGYIFDDDLVLLAEDGGNFGSKDKPIAYRVSGKCWVNNHAHVLKPNKNVNVDYLCYALMFYNTDNLINGATRAKLTQKAMKKIKIPMLSLDLQIMVVNKIKNVENLIKKRRQQNDLLTILVKSRFVELFGDPVLNNKNWKVYKLGECLNRIDNGKSFTCSNNLRIKDYPAILKLSAVTYGDYRPNENKALIEEKQFLESAEVHKGDLLFTRKNTPELVGMAAYVFETPPKLMMPDLIFRLVPNERLNSIFLWQLLTNTNFRVLIRSISNGSAKSMSNISKDRLSRISIICPPIHEQQKIEECIYQVDKSRLAVQKSLDELEILKKSLLQEYFG